MALQVGCRRPAVLLELPSFACILPARLKTQLKDSACVGAVYVIAYYSMVLPVGWLAAPARIGLQQLISLLSLDVFSTTKQQGGFWASGQDLCVARMAPAALLRAHAVRTNAVGLLAGSSSPFSTCMPLAMPCRGMAAAVCQQEMWCACGAVKAAT